MTAAAVIGAVLLGVIALFQLGLAAGMPWGAAAWGGEHPGVLPRRLRIASGVAGVVFYPAVALLVLASAEVVEAGWVPLTGRGTMWALTGLFALASLPNFLSRSKVERIWGPVALAVAVCCALVASSM